MQKLCICGCNEFFEKTANRMVVKPEHRHEYRKKMERERHRNNRDRINRENGLQPKNPGRIMCDVKCPADGEIYKMAFDSPPAVMPRIYCRKHEYNRERTADGSMFMAW